MTLPQNVVDALSRVQIMCDDEAERSDIGMTDWPIVRAHLLSQDAEIDRLRGRAVPLTEWQRMESRLAAADALLRDIKDWDVNQAQGTYLMVPLNLRKRIQAHLSENPHDRA